MPLLRLLHAFATGAATFTLAPTLPAVPLTPKSSRDAFGEDAAKLKGDFDRALTTLKQEVDPSGQSGSPEA
jgi:hypothetical protein